jgi:hypothetical protein
MMKKNVLLEQAHALLVPLISKDDVVCDMTMGNGHDTLFLSTLAKEVYAFDIQQKALDNTSMKIEGLDHVHLILDSHEHVLNYVQDFKGAIFNLGYLPQGNPNITTMTDTTLKTLNLLVHHMKKGDFIQLVIYPGHDEGYKESQAIDAWILTLSPHMFQITTTHFLNETARPPYLYMIYKTKDES